MRLALKRAARLSVAAGSAAADTAAAPAAAAWPRLLLTAGAGVAGPPPVAAAAATAGPLALLHSPLLLGTSATTLPAARLANSATHAASLSATSCWPPLLTLLLSRSNSAHAAASRPACASLSASRDSTRAQCCGGAASRCPVAADDATAVK